MFVVVIARRCGWCYLMIRVKFCYVSLEFFYLVICLFCTGGLLVWASGFHHTNFAFCLICVICALKLLECSNRSNHQVQIVGFLRAVIAQRAGLPPNWRNRRRWRLRWCLLWRRHRWVDHHHQSPSLPVTFQFPPRFLIITASAHIVPLHV